MSARTPYPLAFLTIILLLTPLGAQEAVVRQDKVIAGGPKDALEVRHLVLRGTNQEIGKALATIAKERFGIAVDAGPDSLRTRAQRRYIEKNYPILFDRMRGVAGVYGKKLDDDRWNLSGLSYLSLKAGCSVMYFPPTTTATKTGIVSRITISRPGPSWARSRRRAALVTRPGRMSLKCTPTAGTRPSLCTPMTF